MTKDEQFDTFWKCFPRRIAKGNARKAFDKAIKKTTLETMLEAITKYVACKPQWQDYCHPASWLNSERWSDEWEPEQPKPSYSHKPIGPVTYTTPAINHQSREEYLRAEIARSERTFR